MPSWKGLAVLIAALAWLAASPAQAQEHVAKKKPASAAAAAAAIEAQAQSQVQPRPYNPQLEAAVELDHHVVLPTPPVVLPTPFDPPDPSPPGQLSDTPDLLWAYGPPGFVHDIYFARSAWGTRIAVPPSDHPQQWRQEVWQRGPLWFVIELDGAPDQLLCLRWMGAGDQVKEEECQAMPSGRARLSYASPYLGTGAARTSRAELVIVPDEDTTMEDGEALATLSFGAGGDTRTAWSITRDTSPLPSFPWPPPRPTSKTRIESRWLVDPDGTLGDAAERLDRALGQARYEPPAYYAIPGGFAMATRMEQIQEDGTPVDDALRWSTEVPPRKIKSLGDYLRALLSAPEGFYRVIVFTFTDRPVATSSVQVSEADALAWGSDGGDRLPDSVASQPFTRQHRCLVLVYEFQKVAGSEPTPHPDGAPPASVHLQRSGISAALQP